MTDTLRKRVDEPLSAPPDWGDPPEPSWYDLREPIQDALRRGDGEGYERLVGTSDDPNQPAHALAFIAQCPLTTDEERRKGRRLGSEGIWLPWQDRLTRHLYGTRAADGTREVEEVYAEMPKGAGKSTYLAALMLYELKHGAYGGELYSAAIQLNQAMVVWSIAKTMLDIDDRLRAGVEVRDYRGCHELEYPPRDSIYMPITGEEDTQHGFNPSVVAFDELHLQKNRGLYDTIDDSMGKRSNPLLFEITNSGHDRNTLCYDQRKYALQNNEGQFDDPQFLGVVYGAPEEADPWDPETWKRANPGIGTTVSLDWLAQKAEKAQRIPSKQNAFRRWQLGQWTSAETKWIRPADWDEAEEHYRETQLEGMRCYGGLDLGESHDLSAWVMLFPDEEDPQKVRVLCRAWCPEERLHADDNPYRDQYRTWADEGWMNVSPGQVMDYMEPGGVQDQVAADADRFGLVQMAVDRNFQGHQVMVNLRDREGIDVVSLRTTYTDMTSPCEEFERRIRMEPPKLVHRGNPVLSWAVSNCALKAPDPDRKRPVRDGKHAKIDPVVSTLMALDRAMRQEEPEAGTPYEEEDLLVL